MRRVFIESLTPFWSVGVAIVGLSLLNSISVTTVYYVKSGWPELTPQYQTGLESGSSPCQPFLKRSWRLRWWTSYLGALLLGHFPL